MSNINDTIIDMTKPNAGRVYDYLIGGHHYYPVDQQMADQLLQKAPFIKQLAMLTRWFLGKGAKQAAEWGFRYFLDFASGLPTNDHIHRVTPPETRIIYSDIDPITVQVGNNIINEEALSDRVRYVTCDTATPEKMLKSEAVKSLFGNERKIAIGLNGIVWFLNDEQLKHIFSVLYEWAGVGSTIFLTAMDLEGIPDELQIILDMYTKMGQLTCPRSRKNLARMAEPWKVVDPGLLLLEEWVNKEPKISKQASEKWGGGGIYGGFLKK